MNQVGCSRISQQVRFSKRELVALFWIVILLGGFLGLLTSSLAYFLLRTSPLHTLLFSAIGCALCVIVTSFYLYAHDYSNSEFINLVLPFRFERDRIRVVAAKPYQPTLIANRLASQISKDAGLTGEFQQEWASFRRDGRVPDLGMLPVTRDLLHLILLAYVRKFGDLTLSPAAVFSRRGTPSLLSHRSIPVDELPSPFRENRLLRSRKVQTFESLRIPVDAGWDSRERKWTPGKSAPELILSSIYGRIEFSFSPYFMHLVPGRREERILNRYCGEGYGKDIWAATFVLRVGMRFSGFRVLTKEFQNGFLPWADGLCEYVRENLGWQACVREDSRRALTKLSSRLSEFEKRFAAGRSGDGP